MVGRWVLFGGGGGGWGRREVCRLGRVEVEGAGMVGEAMVGPRRAPGSRSVLEDAEPENLQMQVHAQHFYINAHKPGS